jgi:hypothetical protein
MAPNGGNFAIELRRTQIPGSVLMSTLQPEPPADFDHFRLDLKRKQMTFGSLWRSYSYQRRGGHLWQQEKRPLVMALHSPSFRRSPKHKTVTSEQGLFLMKTKVGKGKDVPQYGNPVRDDGL